MSITNPEEKRKIWICELHPPEETQHRQETGSKGHSTPTGRGGSGAVWEEKALHGKKKSKSRTNVNQTEKNRCDKVSKQCYDTELERVPPEYEDKVNNLNRRCQTKMTDDTSPWKNQKNEIRSDNWQLQLTKTSVKFQNNWKGNIEGLTVFWGKIIKWHLVSDNIHMTKKNEIFKHLGRKKQIINKRMRSGSPPTLLL